MTHELRCATTARGVAGPSALRQWPGQGQQRGDHRGQRLWWKRPTDRFSPGRRPAPFARDHQTTAPTRALRPLWDTGAAGQRRVVLGDRLLLADKGIGPETLRLEQGVEGGTPGPRFLAARSQPFFQGSTLGTEGAHPFVGRFQLLVDQYEAVDGPFL